MKVILALLFIAVFVGACCFMSGVQQDDFQHCVDAASARYPASGSMPAGQPFKEVYRCMTDSGYAQDTQTFKCQGGDYTSVVMDETCYRPTTAIPGFFHDIDSVFR